MIVIQSMLEYGDTLRSAPPRGLEFARRGDVHCSRCYAYRQCWCKLQQWLCLDCGRAGFMLIPIDAALEIHDSDFVAAPHDCGSAEDDGVVGWVASRAVA